MHLLLKFLVKIRIIVSLAFFVCRDFLLQLLVPLGAESGDHNENVVVDISEIMVGLVQLEPDLFVEEARRVQVAVVEF